MQRKQMQNFNAGLGADENTIKKLEIEMDKSTLLMIQVRI
jgi:hypothetical protein